MENRQDGLLTLLLLAIIVRDAVMSLLIYPFTSASLVQGAPKLGQPI